MNAANTSEGRATAWRVNVGAMAAFVRRCARYRLTLVHISSDYVFDGTRESHDKTEQLTPLGVYGQTEAAAEARAATAERHYIVRTSLVIGVASDFVAAMANLANRDIVP